jgi:hypothetical protein
MGRDGILAACLADAARRREDVSRGGAEAQRGCALANTGWTNEARAASIAVRQAKAAARAKARGSNPRWDEKPGDGFWKRIGKKLARDFGRNDPANPPLPRSPEPSTPQEKLFAEQQKRAGKEFLGGWYPRGADGRNVDPRIGETTAEAPYGYVEGTKTPRKEPLYDQWGRPIIPRPKKDWFEADVAGFGALSQDFGLERAKVWIRKVDEATAKWGPFGQKKRWMDAHPGATEGEWEKADAEKMRTRKGQSGENGANHPQEMAQLFLVG